MGNSSLGYKHLQEYTLIVDGLTIFREDGSGFCPYASIPAFLKNWQVIRIL